MNTDTSIEEQITQLVKRAILRNSLMDNKDVVIENSAVEIKALIESESRKRVESFVEFIEDNFPTDTEVRIDIKSVAVLARMFLGTK